MQLLFSKQSGTWMKKIMLLAVFYFSSFLSSTAQREGSMNQPKYDHQQIHFGFTLGLNVSDFKVNLVSDFRIRDSIYTLESEGVAGLNLGILANLRIGEYFDLRFIPTLSFASRILNYYFIYNDSIQGLVAKSIESNYLEFPVDLKFKSKRIRNYRVYVLAGAKYTIDMISQASVDAKDKDIVKLKRFDYGYEIGLGFDFYMPYFKFSPEIKMYHGLNNMLQQDGKVYSRPLQSLFSKVFVLSFMFE
jgi:hypothetical protein